MTHVFNTTCRLLSVIVLVASFSACGGGGGGASTTASPPAGSGQTNTAAPPASTGPATSQVNVTYVAGTSSKIDVIATLANDVSLPNSPGELVVNVVPRSFKNESTGELMPGAGPQLFQASFVSAKVIDPKTVGVQLTTSNSLRAGRYKGKLQIFSYWRQPNRGDEFLAEMFIPYDFRVNPGSEDPRMLLVSQWGVAFAKTSTASVLTRKIIVSENFLFGESVQWSANSDASWLSVSSSGNTITANSLELIANPNALPEDQVSYATVTVSSSNSEILPAKIKVGLWKSSSKGVSDITFVQPVESFPNIVVPRDRRTVVSDPIRPYFYVVKEGESIDVYNAHLAQKVGVINVPGGSIFNLAISPDGETLYAADPKSNTIIEINLNSQIVTRRLQLDSFSVLPFFVIRPKGVDLLVVDGNIVNLSRSVGGKLESIPNSYRSRFLFSVSSLDGKRLFDNSRSVFEIDFDQMSGGRFYENKINDYFSNFSNSSGIPNSVGGLVSYSDDVNQLFVVTQGCQLVRTSQVGQLLIDSVGNSVASTKDGRSVCMSDRIKKSSGFGAFLAYSPSGEVIATYLVPDQYGLARSTLQSSADGLVVMALSQAFTSKSNELDSHIYFMPIPK
jgi:hypothetical protein